MVAGEDGHKYRDIELRDIIARPMYSQHHSIANESLARGKLIVKWLQRTLRTANTRYDDCIKGVG